MSDTGRGTPCIRWSQMYVLIATYWPNSVSEAEIRLILFLPRNYVRLYDMASSWSRSQYLRHMCFRTIGYIEWDGKMSISKFIYDLRHVRDRSRARFAEVNYSFIWVCLNTRLSLREYYVMWVWRLFILQYSARHFGVKAISQRRFT